MKEFIKKNFALILAFAIPIILIVTVALVTYLPSMFFKSEYDFVYVTCKDNSYRCDEYLDKKYSVVNGNLIINYVNPSQDFNNDGKPDLNNNYSSRIFLHDTEKNVSREITESEAMKLTLSSLVTSPEGVSVSSEYDRGAEFFPFFDSGSSYGHYLVKGGSRKKLNLINSDDRYYYRDSFKFIGWVIN